MTKDGISLVYRIHLGKIREMREETNSFDVVNRIHIAVTQIHSQPGVVERLLEDTRQCVKDILKSDRQDETKTVRNQLKIVRRNFE